MAEVTCTEHRLARAWYIKYPVDAYALGPYRYDKPVSADVASYQALQQFGERPSAIWPDGPTEEVGEYEYPVYDPDAEESEKQIVEVEIVLNGLRDDIQPFEIWLEEMIRSNELVEDVIFK